MVKQTFDIAEYTQLVEQIEPSAVWLRSATIRNHHGHSPVPNAVVNLSAEYTYENKDDGFDGFVVYTIEVVADDGGDKKGRITLELGVHYLSEKPMKDDLFAPFSETSLTMTTWPYLREFVHTCFGRMGWPPLVLPAFKMGVGRKNTHGTRRPPRRKVQRDG